LVLQEYNKALSKGEIEPIVLTLKQLALLDKNKYQQKLAQAQETKRLTDSIQDLLNNNHYIEAYLLSHRAYRLLPISQSKKLLVITGKKLIPLLKAYSKIEQSFKIDPALFKIQLEKHQKQPPNKWDLIQVNMLIENLNASSQSLQESLNIIESITHIGKKSDISNLKIDIQKQMSFIMVSKELLISIAQSASANVLLSLNQKLVAESENMLSLIRPSLAEINLQPLFFKAQASYQPYKTLNENLSLADSNQKNNNHAIWYKNWSALEDQVLNIGDGILNYVSTSPIRIKQLNLNKHKYEQSNHLGKFSFENVNKLMAQHTKFAAIIKQLKRDKTLINYGLSTNFKDK